MTGLYVYAIVPADMPPTQLGTGIDRTPLELVAAPGGVAAVVHEHAGNPYDGADEDVRRWVLEHGDVVERVCDAAGTVLPVSFNVIVAESEGAPARDRLRDWLGQSAGRGWSGGSSGSAAGWSCASRSPSSPTTSRPATRTPGPCSRSSSRAPRVSSACCASGWSSSSGRSPTPWPTSSTRSTAAGSRRIAEEITENRSARTEPGTVAVLTVAVLVARDGVPRVGEELADIQREQPAARIRYLGPWPPYSFADVPALAPGQEADRRVAARGRDHAHAPRIGSRRPGTLKSSHGPSGQAPVAQWIEHLTTDQKVGGSSPFGRTERRGPDPQSCGSGPSPSVAAEAQAGDSCRARDAPRPGPVRSARAAGRGRARWRCPGPWRPRPGCRWRPRVRPRHRRRGRGR